jgi:hypothetical protein
MSLRAKPVAKIIEAIGRGLATTASRLTSLATEQIVDKRIKVVVLIEVSRSSMGFP